MTETHEADSADGDAVLDEALTIIDGALLTMSGRELVSSVEVSDLLLDVRTLLSAAKTPAPLG